MAKVKLKDLSLNNLEYGSGSASVQYDGHTRYIRITDIDDEGHLNDDVVSPKEINEKYVLKDGDILFARTGATVGKTYRYSKTDGNCIYAGYLIRFVPNPDIVYPDYIWYFTKSPQYREFIRNSMKVVAQPNINAKQYGDLEIEVPLKPSQEIIIKRLGEIRKIIDGRCHQLRTLDTLIKARFVEMFGEPSVNDRSYRQRQLGELVVNIIPGWSANGESRRMQGAEKAVLKVSAVTQGVFKPEEHKALPMGTEIKKYVYPHKGDLLFSRANTRELVGATAIIDQDYPNLILPDKLWRVLFTDEINVYYAKYVLSTETIRREFSAQSTGTSGSMFNVSAEKFSAIMIPVPPIQEQELFAAFVSQVDKSKVVVQAALDKAQVLFDSLLQDYFG